MKKAVFFALFAAEVISLNTVRPIAFAEGVFNIITEDKIYTFSYPEIKDVMGGLRLSGENEIIEGIVADVYTPATDAEIVFSPNASKIFTFQKEKDGRYIDSDELREAIGAALSVGGGSVYIKSRAITPKTTVFDLKKQTYERARFTTYYESSNVERSHNIALAAKTLNGKRIKSGETFSFNESVGVRSEERGYKTAKIIKNGKFEEGLGGGVCQVSTTLYNAALLAGLSIEEYHPHTLTVSYIENSFDAMVSYGSADLKIKNDTEGDIFIAAYLKEGSVTFVLFGLKNDALIKRSSVTESVIKAKSTFIESTLLSEGETRTLTSPKNGAVSKGYLIIEKNGKKTRRLIRSDKYQSVTGVIERGNAVSDQES